MFCYSFLFQATDFFFLLFSCFLAQERNKPIDPPKKPEKAPFFLPTIPSLSREIVFKNSDTGDEDKGSQADETNKSRVYHELPASEFLQLLHSSAEMKTCKF